MYNFCPPSGEPNVPQTLRIPYLFHVFHFRKSLFFLSFLEVKSRPRTSKRLTFWLSLSYIFLWFQNCKHLFALGKRERLLRSAFFTFSCFSLILMFCFAAYLFSSPGDFFLILASPETLQIGPWPSKVMLSCGRNAYFQKHMFLFIKNRHTKKHQKNIPKKVSKNHKKNLCTSPQKWDQKTPSLLKIAFGAWSRPRTSFLSLRHRSRTPKSVYFRELGVQ